VGFLFLDEFSEEMFSLIQRFGIKYQKVVIIAHVMQTIEPRNRERMVVMKSSLPRIESREPDCKLN
jgi:hypothetical protein